MSRAPSVAAAGIRRLAIQQDSDDDMVETRSQHRKGETSKDKGKRKATSGSSPKSRSDEAAKARKAPSKAGRKPSDDDDDDDESSSDDEDPVTVRREIMRKIMSVTNADDISSTDFVYSQGTLPARRFVPFKKRSCQSKTLS
jgi:hypothetical protein